MEGREATMEPVDGRQGAAGNEGEREKKKGVGNHLRNEKKKILLGYFIKWHCSAC